MEIEFLELYDTLQTNFLLIKLCNILELYSKKSHSMINVIFEQPQVRKKLRSIQQIESSKSLCLHRSSHGSSTCFITFNYQFHSSSSSSIRKTANLFFCPFPLLFSHCRNKKKKYFNFFFPFLSFRRLCINRRSLSNTTQWCFVCLLMSEKIKIWSIRSSLIFLSLLLPVSLPCVRV